MDDGSTASTNRLTWATIKTKLPDPIKTYVDAIASALTSVFDTSARAITADDSSAATDHDRVIQVNTSSVNVTLADAATMAAGYKVDVHNNSTGNITVKRATGGDTINGAAKNIVLPPQQRLKLRVNAAATGYLIEESTGGLILDATDPSKQAKWDVSGVATGTLITLTPPAAGGTLLTSASSLTGAQAGITLLGSITASNVASLSFTHTGGSGTASFDFTAYDVYIFELMNILPATNAQGLVVNYSQNSGTGWVTSASYSYANIGFSSANSSDNLGGAATATPKINSVGNTIAAGGLNGTFRLIKPSSTTVQKWYYGNAGYFDSSFYQAKTFSMNYTGDTNAVTGIRWTFESGNITSGVIYAYGLRKA